MGNSLNCGRTGQYDQAPVPGRFLDYSQDLLHLFLLTLVYKYSFSIFLKCLHVKRSEPYGKSVLNINCIVLYCIVSDLGSKLKLFSCHMLRVIYGRI